MSSFRSFRSQQAFVFNGTPVAVFASALVPDGSSKFTIELTFAATPNPFDPPRISKGQRTAEVGFDRDYGWVVHSDYRYYATETPADDRERIAVLRRGIDTAARYAAYEFIDSLTA